MESSESESSFSVYLSEPKSNFVKEECSESSIQDPIFIESNDSAPSTHNEDFEDSDEDIQMEANSENLDELQNDKSKKKKKKSKEHCMYYCGFENTSAHKMNVHNQQHNGFDCLMEYGDIKLCNCPSSSCQAIYVSQEDLENHLKNNHKSNSKTKGPYCQYCVHSRRFSHFRSLNHHLIFNHMKTFQCPIKSCKVDLDSHSSLFFHIAKRHENYLNNVEFSCKFCSVKFVKYPTLIKHYRICSNKNIPCPQCDKMLGSEEALKNHLRQHKIQVCTICGKQLKGRSFVTHLQTHERKNFYKCQICSKIFKSSSDRNDHIGE